MVVYYFIHARAICRALSKGVCYTWAYGYFIREGFVLRSAKGVAGLMIMICFVAAGIIFRFHGVPSFGPGKMTPVEKKKPSEVIPSTQGTLLTSYDVRSRSTSREDLLPVRDPEKEDLERLERDFQGSHSKGGSLLESRDIPPRIRDLADQLMDLKNSFDESTLDNVNSVLKEVPLVDIEADKAEIRPSGDGLSLRINIPVDSVDLKN